MLTLEGQIEPFFNMLADKIMHIHASDNDGIEDQHLGIGQGKIDYNWFAETLKKIGYDKSVIIESITNVPRKHPKTKAASRLAFFKRQLQLHKIFSHNSVRKDFFRLLQKQSWHQDTLR